VAAVGLEEAWSCSVRFLVGRAAQLPITARVILEGSRF
jgi:hypothetical protein